VQSNNPVFGLNALSGAISFPDEEKLDVPGPEAVAIYGGVEVKL
jgi:hypothetical protein